MYILIYLSIHQGFPGGSLVKNPVAKQETQVYSVGWENPLKKGMSTHCSILAWEIPWMEKSGGATVHGVTKESDMT